VTLVARPRGLPATMAARSRAWVEALATGLAADRDGGRMAEVAGRVEGAARRTGEVTAGAPPA
jgi:hypothetical protein